MLGFSVASIALHLADANITFFFISLFALARTLEKICIDVDILHKTWNVYNALTICLQLPSVSLMPDKTCIDGRTITRQTPRRPHYCIIRPLS
jgi:hypothetical protein